MAVTLGQSLELVVEKPVAGGRMLARHEGEVVLVAGAIPGERVTARVVRADRRMAFADTIEVLERSADRREPDGDPACGGCLYARIAYSRQLQLKADLVRDTFVRIGRVTLPEVIEVAGSPEHDYRMRARFHVHAGQPWFYKEGTHEPCDPRQTRQVPGHSIEAVEAAVASLAAQGLTVVSVELSENIAGDQRALHLELRSGQPSPDSLDRVVAAAGLTGCTARAPSTGSGQAQAGSGQAQAGSGQGPVGSRQAPAGSGRTDNTIVFSAGDPVVSDTVRALSGGRVDSDDRIRRHPEAFFQANRFLIGSLVSGVIDSVLAGPVLDLYAGVGLFSVALAATGHQGLHAVEGDPVSGRDLLRNAAAYRDQLRVSRSSIEAFLARSRPLSVQTLIVDPPRTGMSKEAVDSVAKAGADRIVYVSCDPPTMARDSRRLLDAGYRLLGVRAFDLFPNTPHVETLAVFER